MPDKTEIPTPKTDTPTPKPEPATPAPKEIPEPTFTLRAQDRFFLVILAAWIQTARLAGVSEQKIKGAQEIYIRADEWRAKNPDRVKLPD